MDCVPVVSQLKSAVLAVQGDLDGARATQENFSKQCIVISQLRSTVELATGQSENARETQVTFFSAMDQNTKSLPVLGHLRGAVAYLVGDYETGSVAMQESTKTTLWAGLLVSAWHIGLAIGATASSAAVPAKLTLEEKLAKRSELESDGKPKPLLDGKCLCCGECVCSPAITFRVMDEECVCMKS